MEQPFQSSVKSGCSTAAILQENDLVKQMQNHERELHQYIVMQLDPKDISGCNEVRPKSVFRARAAPAKRQSNDMHLTTVQEQLAYDFFRGLVRENV